MKIVITVDDFHLDRYYLEHYLATELVRLGHEVHVFSFCSNCAGSEKNSSFNYTLHRLPFIASFDPYHVPGPRAFGYIARFVRSVNPDIIHCQPLFSPLSLAFITYCSKRQQKIVGSLVSGIYSIESTRSFLKYVLTKAVVEYYIQPRLSCLFVKSNGLKTILLNLFSISEEKVRTIPLGADPEIFNIDDLARNETRKDLGATPDDIIVTFSGRINPSKKINVIIEAITPIIKEMPHVKFMIRGRGDTTYINQLVMLCKRLGIYENVSFLPWANRKELAAFFNASDITVWPNGASISMVEAAATGRPLIAMKSPIEEYVLTNDNGFTFNCGDVEEIQRQIRLLVVDNHLRAEMGHRSRSLVESVLNWRTIAEQYIETYEHALKYGL